MKIKHSSCSVSATSYGQRSQPLRQSGKTINRPVFSRQASGLTLVEILMAAAVAGFIFAIISRVILTQVSTTQRIELGQRYREMANRVNYLLAVEGSESSDVDLTTSVSIPTVCTNSFASATSGALFKLAIPKGTGEYGSPLNVSDVYYYNGSGGDLIRCGPLAQQNGGLDHDFSQTAGSPVAAIVSRATTVTVLGDGVNTSTCNGESSSDRQIAYQLGFTGANYVPQCAVVRAKTIFVCNPVTDILARFTGSVSGTSLSVGAISFGSVAVGQSLIGSGLKAGTLITGGSGTSFTLNLSQSALANLSLATARDRSSFTGSISGNTLTASSVSGVLGVGQEIYGVGVSSDTFITDFGSGSGGSGTYTVTPSQTVGSSSMTSSGSRVGDCS
jgi:type II secretory pathway pseudopilin PulG